jgi:AraC family transcriptional regulator
MSDIQLPSVDFNQEDEIRKVASSAFFLKRYETGLKGLGLTHASLPACEIPEHYVRQHLMVVSLQPELGLERKLGDRLKTENINTGHVALLPAHINCWQGLKQDKSEGLLLTLEPWMVDRCLDDTANSSQIEMMPTFAQPDPLIYGIALSLKSAFEVDESNCTLYVESLVNTLSMHLLQHYTTHGYSVKDYGVGLSQQQLQTVIDYIDVSLDQNIKLADLAVIVNMSVYYFCLLFKQSMAISPYQYVLQQRMERAKQLLRSKKEMAIADVALQCGFANQSHFTKNFRRLVGTTPKVYRDQML